MFLRTHKTSPISDRRENAATKTLQRQAIAIQTTLAINKPGDEYEQEADRVAGRVLRSHERPDTKRVQGSVTGQIAAPPVVDDVLRSSGQPLDAATRAFMEPRFGHDFSRVRVHSDTAAGQSARDINARAYTAGHHIVFGGGRFAPGTPEGRGLLAHELTHVVQQSGSEETGSRPLVQRSEMDDWAQVRKLLNLPRPLTPFEAAQARRVFGRALDTSDVEISEGGLMTIGGYARTLPDRIYFPDDSFGKPDFIPFLIHELTHVWQYQQGGSIPGLLFEALIAHYDYGEEPGLREAWERGQSFDDFTTEQQASILADYYEILVGVSSGDLSAYQGFVDDVRAGRAKQRRYRTVEPLELATLDVAKANEDFRVKTEAEIIRELRLPMSVDDPRAVTRSHRLLALCSKLWYWSASYRERINVHRSGDELVNLLFSQISEQTRTKIFKIWGVEATLAARRGSGSKTTQ